MSDKLPREKFTLFWIRLGSIKVNVSDMADKRRDIAIPANIITPLDAPESLAMPYTSKAANIAPINAPSVLPTIE